MQKETELGWKGTPANPDVGPSSAECRNRLYLSRFELQDVVDGKMAKLTRIIRGCRSQTFLLKFDNVGVDPLVINWSGGCKFQR